MSARNAIKSTLCFAMGFALIALMSTVGVAQNFGGSVVGGVSIDANGVLNGQMQEIPADVRAKLINNLKAVDADIDVETGLRVISLRGLEAQLMKARDEGKELPADVRYLAGLQRIEYIMLSPETNDVLIAGPGEGWKVTKAGNVVGKKSGMPVVQLEDLLIAMRTVENAGQGQGISVSIDPTEEGVKNLQKFYTSINNFRPNMQPMVEKAMGPQTIQLTGVPTESRFAQVLVAADYKMKRLSMGLEKAPLKNMPSLMALAQKKNASFKKAAPRFWMECNYEPVATSEDGKIWQLRGKGVKTLTEESFYNEHGERKTKGKVNKYAKQWADSMTDNYDDLSKVEPVFRELRNMMDISVASAIIAREGLLQKVKLEIPAIMGQKDDIIDVTAWSTPKTVPTQCSFVKLSRSWLVTASGGVQVDSWAVASNTAVVKEIGDVHQNALTKTADRWWWNSKVN